MVTTEPRYRLGLRKSHRTGDGTATIDRERLFGATALVGHVDEVGGLRPDLDRDQARDVVWTLISPDLYRLLVGDRGWSHATYERWLADTLMATLLPPPAP